MEIATSFDYTANMHGFMFNMHEFMFVKKYAKIIDSNINEYKTITTELYTDLINKIHECKKKENKLYKGEITKILIDSKFKCDIIYIIMPFLKYTIKKMHIPAVICNMDISLVALGLYKRGDYIKYDEQRELIRSQRNK